VIGMTVGEEHRIDAPDAIPQRLLPKVGRRIDEDLSPPGSFDVDRGAQP
jgi:hypothetical protein